MEEKIIITLLAINTSQLNQHTLIGCGNVSNSLIFNSQRTICNICGYSINLNSTCIFSTITFYGAIQKFSCNQTMIILIDDCSIAVGINNICIAFVDVSNCCIGNRNLDWLI